MKMHIKIVSDQRYVEKCDFVVVPFDWHRHDDASRTIVRCDDHTIVDGVIVTPSLASRRVARPTSRRQSLRAS